jgi:hypothetical protein
MTNPNPNPNPDRVPGAPASHFNDQTLPMLRRGWAPTW